MKISEFFRNDSDARITELLVLHSRESLPAAEALAGIFSGAPGGIAPKLAEIVQCEHRGDELIEKLHVLLDEVFITKQLPKEHVSRLISHLDDILDDMRDAARYVVIYAISTPTKEAIEFSEIINTMVQELFALMEKLLALSSEDVQGAYGKLKKLEGRADDLRSQGTQALAASVNSTALWRTADKLYLLIAWKEIYAKLERVTDHCLHAVNEITAIVRNY